MTRFWTIIRIHKVVLVSDNGTTWKYCFYLGLTFKLIPWILFDHVLPYVLFLITVVRPLWYYISKILTWTMLIGTSASYCVFIRMQQEVRLILVLTINWLRCNLGKISLTHIIFITNMEFDAWIGKTFRWKFFCEEPMWYFNVNLLNYNMLELLIQPFLWITNEGFMFLLLFRCFLPNFFQWFVILFWRNNSKI